jgi:hypothetical protein
MGRGGDRKPKGAPFPHLAMHPDLSVLSLCGELAEGQSKARGVLFPLLPGPHLTELLEDLFVVFRGDAWAGVQMMGMPTRAIRRKICVFPVHFGWILGRR